MIILAIDTSCDDTCIAVLKIVPMASSSRILDKIGKNCKLKILSNIVSSQVKLHAKYGGVYPALAKREHQKNLPIIFGKAIRKSKNPKIDLIAVTVGPGLEPCLWTGINFAKDLARKLNLKIIPVNHIEAHILSNFQFSIFNFQKHLPAVCLVVSGGHTQLVLMRDIGKYKILGETRDDAAGECFDKTARILGLGYPGGPAIAAEAAKFSIFNFSRFYRGSSMAKPSGQFSIKLPRPMIYSKDYDFSFSGLKTAVLYQNQKSKIKNQKYKQTMCREIQQAVIDVLIKKTIKAAKDYSAKTVLLGGGVAANEELKKQMGKMVKDETPSSKFQVPSSEFCTDNAAMVAVAAYFHRDKAKHWKDIKADANLRIN